jgi:hypothetical protein
MPRRAMLVWLLLVTGACGGKAVVDGMGTATGGGGAGGGGCSDATPCDATHSVAASCAMELNCPVVIDACGNERICAACPAANPAVSSSCGPAGGYCSMTYPSNPYCGVTFTCGADGRWVEGGEWCE